MPETIEDVERKIAGLKEDIPAIKAVPVAERSKNKKDLVAQHQPSDETSQYLE
jgi:hypothetical protein